MVRSADRRKVCFATDKLRWFQNWENQDAQAALVQWESQLVALERDHGEILSPKIRRALLLNILPHSIQTRFFEHLDRVVSYAQVREEVVSLVQITQNPDAMDTSAVEREETLKSGQVTTNYTQEEEAMDLAALS